MQTTDSIAKLLRDLHFGGNWTGACLKELLEGITWQQATTQIGTFHSIATLVFHINYFVEATIGVLKDQPLTAQDKLSFAHPPIESEGDWQNLLEKTWKDAEQLASAVEALPESQLWETFVEERYGTYYRCLHGPIEHGYYHAGQIALIKSILANDKFRDVDQQ